jgi:RimJ/RimL family protein N-acetyltransferase
MLITTRLTLRPLTDGDAEQFIVLAGDLAVSRMTSDIPHPLDAEKARAWLAPARGEQRFAIDLKGRLIGSAGYFMRDHGRAEMGFWLGRDFWGRGYATEAGWAVVEHAFVVGNVDTLTSSHFVDNGASQRVLAKLGFTATGYGRIWSMARNAEVTAVLLALPRARVAERLRLSATAAQGGSVTRGLWRNLFDRVRGPA